MNPADPTALTGDDPIARLDPPGLLRRVLSDAGLVRIHDLAARSPEALASLPGVGHRRWVLLEALHHRAQAVIAGNVAVGPRVDTVGASDLATRLTARGIALDAPWAEVLVMLPRQVRRDLQATGLEVLADVVAAVEPPRPQGWATGAGSRPWADVVPYVSARVASALRRFKLTTMDDVLVAWLAGRFVGARNLGRRSNDEIRQALRSAGANPAQPRVQGAVPSEVAGVLESIARDGLDAWRHGSPEPIATPDALIARVLGSVEEDLRDPLRDWLLGRRRIASFASEHGVAWHTASRPLFLALDHLRVQFGDVARGVAGPLLAWLRAHGPLLHRTDLRRLLPGVTVRRARFILAVAGEPVMHRWHRDFLSGLRPSRMDGVMQDLRAHLRRVSVGRRTLEALAVRLEKKYGLRPPRHVVEILVRTVLAGHVSTDGRITVRSTGQKSPSSVPGTPAARRAAQPPSWMRP